MEQLDPKTQTRTQKMVQDMSELEKREFISKLKSSGDADLVEMAQQLENTTKPVTAEDRKVIEEGDGDDDPNVKKIYVDTDPPKATLENVEKLASTVEHMERTSSERMINDLVSLKSQRVPDFDAKLYKAILKTKSFAELAGMYNERKDEIDAMFAPVQQ